MKFGKLLIGTVLAAFAVLSTAVMAADHVVKAQVTSFNPIVIKITPGDTVSWTGMNGHISNTIFTDKTGKHEYIPKGAKGWTSAMGENYSTDPLTVEGVYFYKCDPHWGAGMGGVIVVGEPTNLQEVVDSKPKGAFKRLVKKAKKCIESSELSCK